MTTVGATMKNDFNKQNNVIPSIGFISAPAWSDPSPYEFTTIIREKIITQQAFPLLPDFNYSLDNIASELIYKRFSLCGKSLHAAKCDLIVQVGSPFAWAQMKTEDQARKLNDRIAKESGIPCIMTALAIVDALRAHQVKNIAICTYYCQEWKTQFSKFLTFCDFKILHATNFYEQGLIKSEYMLFGYNWANATNIIKESIKLIKNKVPEVEAIVIVGTGIRTLNILTELETIAQCPVVPADTSIYWQSARYLNLTLSSQMGSFKTLPFKCNTYK